jgi:pimeloyl-ACP methyl ester carboxylesterase
MSSTSSQDASTTAGADASSTSARDAPAMSGAERFVTVEGTRLRVLDEGSGPPVLLLHGFPDRAEMWRELGRLLREAGRRTLALDLPGFGESDAPAERAAYRADHVVSQISQMLPELGLDGPVDLIGHDWGAYLSWTVCLTRPDLVRRHVALSVGHQAAFLRAGWEQKRKSRYMLLFVIPGVAERIMSAGDFQPVRTFLGQDHPDIDRVVADLSRPGRLTAGLRWYRANVPASPLRRWPKCTVPTLGILPTADNYLAEDQMVNSARYMAAEWRYARLDGLGHWAPLEAPERVAELALDWLGSGHPPA